MVFGQWKKILSKARDASSMAVIEASTATCAAFVKLARSGVIDVARTAALWRQISGQAAEATLVQQRLGRMPHNYELGRVWGLQLPAVENVLSFRGGKVQGCPWCAVEMREGCPRLRGGEGERRGPLCTVPDERA